MGSMNWLGFSLCPQGLPSQVSNHGGLSSGTEECYDLGSDSTVPSSFGFLEAFHRSSDNQSQDWNMKGNSEISMLMGNQEADDEQPKLENFLGSSHSFKENNSHNNNHLQNNGVYMLLNDYNNINNHNHNNNDNNNNGMENPSSTNNGLNVSMIKTWLKSNNNPSQEMVIMSEDTNNNSGANGGGNGGTQSLSLSMGTGPHSSVAALPLLGAGGDGSDGANMGNSLCENSSSSSKQQSDIVSNTTTNTTNNHDTQSGALESVPRKSIETFGQRTSIYRGVTRHRWTGRYEAHLWDNSCRREGQTRKGRQVYLGGYDKEEKAARAYDLAAIKYWGTTITTNFPISDYEKEVEDMQHMTRQEYVASLRRKSSGFSRGASIYRGVTRHHQHGRWQARIGRVAGNKDLYLGTFSTQEEAAEAYDIAAIKFRGLNAVTNFEINRYDVNSILESTNLPIGGAAKKRLKEVEEFTSTDSNNNAQILRPAITATEIGIPNYGSWPGIAFQQAHPVTMQYHPYGNNAGQLQERVWCKQEQDPDSIGSNHYSDLSQQVQMGHGTHNFFQMDNLMGSGSDSGGYGLPYGNGNGNGNENYYSFLSQQANNSNSNSNNGVVRGAVGYYDQGSTCTNWVPTAIPTIASRTASMAVVGGPTGGVPPFAVWNNT